MEKFRKNPGAIWVDVYRVEVSPVPWRVDFYVGDERVGGGQFHTAEQADEAAANFMFRGVAYASGS
jgi:hypothetical protein